MTLNADEAVAKGAKLLDEHEPAWYERIDLDRLDQNSSKNCVLAQLFNGEFYRALDFFGIEEVDSRLYGFSGNSPFRNWADHNASTKPLTDAWKAFILARRAQLTSESVAPPQVTVTVSELEKLVTLMSNGLVKTVTLDFKGIELTVTQ
jgi:hypothetical protein